ncbi:MAG: hypothetical protein AAF590_09475 [Pseudomonadota bacterium]
MVLTLESGTTIGEICGKIGRDNLSVLAYNLKRMTAIMGVKPLIAAIQS